MIREKVTVQDFERIGTTNDYFIWNFVQTEEERGNLVMYSIFDYQDLEIPNQLTPLLDSIDIPYFESYTKNSINFLSNLHGIKVNKLFERPSKSFAPICLTFRRKRKMLSTHEGYCYCVEGFLDMIYELNPEFILNSKLD